MDVLVGHLIHTLEVDAACVLAYNSSSLTLEYIDAKGFRTSSLQHTSLKLGNGLAGKAALERSLVYFPDLNAQDTSFQQSPQFGKEEFVTYIAQPLIAKGELVGVLEVFHREKLSPNPEWFKFLDSLSRTAAIAIDRLNLFDELTRSNIELKLAYDATIEGWARAIELRDGDTEGHSRRVEALTLNLARTLGISNDELLHMRRGAMLHDIGKIAIPDGILLKTGKLTEEEWLVMKRHPTLAYDMLSKIDYLKPALDIPLNHHERWDGSGYPQGLAGEDIPIQARIFAVVDVWDALQSDRPYREAWSEEKTISYLKEKSGSEFDPRVVDAFLRLLGKD
jgi:putative nucleotidyltransferase with HDIG domain